MPQPWSPTSRIEEIDLPDPERFASEVAPAYRPVVIRGLAQDWPLVEAGRKGAAGAADYLRRFDRGAPAKVMRAPPEIDGRLFYNEAMRGYNFTVAQATISALMEELVALPAEGAPAIYAGSSPTAQHLPGFSEANAMPLSTPGGSPRIWIGNRTHVAPHYDVSDNVAVVALGRRRFTLFPPEATPDLYVGPLDVTLAGQPVSMVDMRAPDLERYPRFARAMETALVAELHPGDALYIPTMWWHAVDALERVNILVNYWYNHPPAGSPFAALLNAILSIRELPEPERGAWRVWFEHYVFAEDAANAAAHLPPHAQGVVGPQSSARNEAIRHYVMRALNPR